MTKYVPETLNNYITFVLGRLGNLTTTIRSGETLTSRSNRNKRTIRRRKINHYNKYVY